MVVGVPDGPLWVAARAGTFVAQESVFDVVDGAQVCGPIVRFGEVLRAIDAGKLVCMCLVFALCGCGAVRWCWSSLQLLGKSEAETRHGCDGIFGFGDLLEQCLLERP